MTETSALDSQAARLQGDVAVSWQQLKERMAQTTDHESRHLLHDLKLVPYLDPQDLRTSFERFVQSESGKSLFIVVGDSGTGKSTFFANLIEEFHNCEHIAYLMYSSSSYNRRLFQEIDEIDAIISESLDLKDGFLSTLGQLLPRESKEHKVVIVFDAINEFGSGDRQPKELMTSISQFVSQIPDHRRVRVVVTIRPGVWRIIRSPTVVERNYCFRGAENRYWVELSNWSTHETEIAYVKYQAHYNVSTQYQSLNAQLQESIRNPLSLYILMQSAGIDGDIVYPSLHQAFFGYLSRLVEEGQLTSEARSFLEEEMMPSLINNLEGSFTNSFVGDPKRAREHQLLTNLVSVNLLEPEEDRHVAETQYRFRFERFFDYLGGQRLYDLMAPLDEAKQSTTVAALVDKLDHFSFMWGPIEEALVLSFHYERVSLIRILVLKGDIVLTEMLIKVLISAGLADRDGVCQLNESVWRKRKRARTHGSRFQIERLCTAVAGQLDDQELLLRVIERSGLPNGHLAEHVFSQWRTDCERGLTRPGENGGYRILDRMLSRIKWYRPRALVKLFMTSSLVTAAIYFFEPRTTGKHLHEIWNPLLETLHPSVSIFLKICSASLGKRWIASIIERSVIWLLDRKREYKSSANFKEFAAFFKLPLQEKEHVRRLVRFLEPSMDDTFADAEIAIQEAAEHAANPPAAFVTQKILEGYGMRREGEITDVVDLATELFEQDVAKCHEWPDKRPSMYSMCMYSTCFDLLRMSADMDRTTAQILLGKLRGMVVSFMKVPDYKYYGSAGSYNPLFLGSYATGYAMACGSVKFDLGGEFITKMQNHPQVIRDYAYDFGLYAMRGEVELALEGARHIVNVDDRIVQERLGKLLVRVGMQRPKLVRQFLEEIPEEKRRDFKDLLIESRGERYEGDILSSVELATGQLLSYENIAELFMWAVNQMVQHENLFSWGLALAIELERILYSEKAQDSDSTVMNLAS